MLDYLTVFADAAHSTLESPRCLPRRTYVLLYSRILSTFNFPLPARY